MKLIVGLGNVGKEYQKTRHNVGFMVLDSYGFSYTLEKKFQAYLYSTTIHNEKCLFIKPTTFMNLSGNAILKIVKYYDISPHDILVIHDDLDLPFGHIKLKESGSSGGHNGIKSIIESLGTQEFSRFKIGIGRVEDSDVIDYVLGKFSKKDLEFLETHYSYFQEIISSFIQNGIQKTMNSYNSKEKIQ